MEKTIIHERVELSNEGKNTTAIIKLKSGWVVLGDNQTLPGYCILLSDPVEETLNSISQEKRKQFLYEMTIVGDVLLELFNAITINYSILGNTDRALHAHIHPRYNWEKEENRKMPPFIYNFKNEANKKFEYSSDKEIIEKIKEKLSQRIVSENAQQLFQADSLRSQLK